MPFMWTLSNQPRTGAITWAVCISSKLVTPLAVIFPDRVAGATVFAGSTAAGATGALAAGAARASDFFGGSTGGVFGFGWVVQTTTLAATSTNSAAIAPF